jgi:hypothetical protein
MDGQHRAGGGAHHLFRDRSGDEFPPTGMTVGGDHDEVDILIVRCPHNFFGGITFAANTDKTGS